MIGSILVILGTVVSLTIVGWVAFHIHWAVGLMYLALLAITVGAYLQEAGL